MEAGRHFRIAVEVEASRSLIVVERGAPVLDVCLLVVLKIACTVTNRNHNLAACFSYCQVRAEFNNIFLYLFFAKNFGIELIGFCRLVATSAGKNMNNKKLFGMSVKIFCEFIHPVFKCDIHHIGSMTQK